MQVFTHFFHADSLMFLFMLLVCFLLGLLAAYFFFEKKFKDYISKIAFLSSDNDRLLLQNRELGERDAVLQEDLKKLRLQLEDATLAQGKTNAKYAEFEAELSRLRAALDATSSELTLKGEELESLKFTLMELQPKEEEVSYLPEPENEYEEALRMVEVDLGREGLYNDLNPEKLIGELVDDNEMASSPVVEPTIYLSHTQKEALDQALASYDQELSLDNFDENVPVSANASLWGDDEDEFVDVPTALTSIESKAEMSAAPKGLRNEFTTRLGSSDANSKDDLTKIEGIGPFIEEKLNKLGIFNFSQIAKLDSDSIAKLTEAIEFFPGRIERDDWVGQAQKLANLSEPKPEKASKPPKPASTSKPKASNKPKEVAEPQKVDDLTKIEGIGPKIAGILNEAGITSFRILSESSVPYLRELLEKAGKRYVMHDPTTWPRQAELAALGKWDELQQLKDTI